MLFNDAFPAAWVTIVESSDSMTENSIFKSVMKQFWPIYGTILALAWVNETKDNNSY